MSVLTVLLVEDDDGHAVLIQRSLKPEEHAMNIVRVADGQKALDFIAQVDQDDSDNPLVVFLDLNLPVVDGFQVLEQIKGDAETRRIPVIVITTTDDRREMERCYDIGANAYISKPMAFDRFSTTMKSLGQFLSVVTVPS